MALIKDDAFEKPYMLDIMKVTSDKEHQYDMPFYYMGQVIDFNFETEPLKTLNVLGEKNGYQHLFVEGSGKATNDNTKVSWLNNGNFYSLTNVATANDEVMFTRIGANDPEFNLRRDAGLVIRRKNTKNTIFVSIIESHGNYSPVSEIASNSKSNISELKVLHDDEKYTAIQIKDINGKERLFLLSNEDENSISKHKLTINGKSYEWSGSYYFN